MRDIDVSMIVERLVVGTTRPSSPSPFLLAESFPVPFPVTVREKEREREREREKERRVRLIPEGSATLIGIQYL